MLGRSSGFYPSRGRGRHHKLAGLLPAVSLLVTGLLVLVASPPARSSDTNKLVPMSPLERPCIEGSVPQTMGAFKWADVIDHLAGPVDWYSNPQKPFLHQTKNPCDFSTLT
jgi:hypothetical protein